MADALFNAQGKFLFSCALETLFLWASPHIAMRVGLYLHLSPSVWHVVSEDSSHQEVFPADRLNLTDFQGSP